MTRLIYYAILAYLVYAAIRFVVRLALRPKAPQAPRRLTGVMVKDEACGIYIPREDAVRDVIDGREMFFCGGECRRKFLEARKSGR